MAEWLKAHAWKACLGETLTWVRIPLSPPELLPAWSGAGFCDYAGAPRGRVDPRPDLFCRVRWNVCVGVFNIRLGDEFLIDVKFLIVPQAFSNLSVRAAIVKRRMNRR